MTADEPMSTPDSGGLREAVIQRLTETIEHERRWSVMGREGDVRCLSCDLRYAERQEYGCHWEGNAHFYDDEELAEARSEQSHDADSLMVDALAALLAAHPEPVPTPDSADDATVGERKGYRVSLDLATGDIDVTPILYESDDQIERALCAKRTPPCGIVGKHRHGDAPGVFIGQPDDTPPPADDANRAPVSGGLDEGERVRCPRCGGGDMLDHAVAAHVERILAARDAAWVERLAAERDTARREKADAWDEGKAAGLREGKVVTPFHDRFRSANPYRADALTSDDGSGA